MDTKKEDPKAPMMTQASFQGKEMTVMGVHAFSGSNKCLSEEEGKKKDDVGKAHSCCAGYLSVDGRGALLTKIELFMWKSLSAWSSYNRVDVAHSTVGRGIVGQEVKRPLKRPKPILRI